jgi:hypothetical protein
MAAKTTKAEHPASTPIASLADLTRLDGPMTDLWTRPFEAWLRWQTDMMKAVERVGSSGDARVAARRWKRSKSSRIALTWVRPSRSNANGSRDRCSG